MKYQFRNDYSSLGNKKIFEELIKDSDKQNTAYGLDDYSEKAAELIKEKFGAKNAECHFISGGTQTNMVFISYSLRPYEGVIAATTGHINVHETAAVEGSGHKVYSVPGIDGKVRDIDIENAMMIHHDEHMVKLKMVYISNTTEIGTIYTKSELLSLRKVCDKYGLYLYIDGARIGSAVTSRIVDYDPSFIGSIADAFYVGGTKNGLPIGEALVIVNDKLKDSFRYQIKNKGAMLAKGYLLGMCFYHAFKDNLYFDMAKNANQMAYIIKDELIKLGYKMNSSESNQQFIYINKKDGEKLINEYGLEIISLSDKEYLLRIVTSYNTKLEDALEFVNYVRNL